MLKYLGFEKKVEKLYHAIQKKRALQLSDSDKAERGIEFTVRLISNFPFLWERIIDQTPKRSCQWGNTLFCGESNVEADLYVVLNTSTHDYGDNPLPPINFPEAKKVWGLHLEPPEYVKMFRLDQQEEHAKISRFYTNVESLYRKNPDKYIPSPPYNFMHIDRSWDFLVNAPVPVKTEEVCMISSSLNIIPGHRERLQFIERLVQSDLRFSLWGRGDEFKKHPNYRGFAPKKWDALAPCKYSIVVENSIVPFYWTEKITDNLLAFTLPLYHGSPNVSKFLPEDCYIPIDIHDPFCVDKIKDIVTSGEYEKRLPAIIEAREKILHEQNLFAFLSREINIAFT